MKNILLQLAKIAENENISIGALERKIGASKGVISRAIAHQTDIQAKWIQNIVENYPTYNPEWLITGDGKMLRDINILPDENISLISHTIEKKHTRQLIPIYNISAAAGLVSLFNDPTGYTPIDYISLPNIGKVDGGIFAFGDSMYPLIKSGDIVVYRRIQDMFNSIFYGEMYLISYDMEGEEYIVIKYIQKSDDPNYIKLVSQNQNHQPKDIPLSKVKALAMVKASVRFNTMRPN